MAETKKPAAKSAAVKKPTAKTTATKSAPKAEAKVEEVKKVEEAPKAEPKAAPKKVSKGAPKRVNSTRLLEKYNNEIKKNLMEKYKYSSVMEVPHLVKIVLNVGVGEALTNNKAIE